jgi:archaellin
MTRGQVGLDDVLIFLAWILGTALTALVLLCEYTLARVLISTDGIT